MLTLRSWKLALTMTMDRDNDISGIAAPTVGDVLPDDDADEGASHCL